MKTYIFSATEARAIMVVCAETEEEAYQKCVDYVAKNHPPNEYKVEGVHRTPDVLEAGEVYWIED